MLASWYSCDCSVGDDPAPGVELLAGRFVALTRYPSCGPFPCGRARPTRCATSSPGAGAPQGPVSQVVAGRGYYAYEDGRVVLVRGGAERVVDPGRAWSPARWRSPAAAVLDVARAAADGDALSRGAVPEHHLGRGARGAARRTEHHRGRGRARRGAAQRDEFARGRRSLRRLRIPTPRESDAP